MRLSNDFNLSHRFSMRLNDRKRPSRSSSRLNDGHRTNKNRSLFSERDWKIATTERERIEGRY